ncbi:FAD dependent oxidoreductase [Muricomes intestini]|uniref:FAD dependent oxidoreductase n=1 Tax=Muricomes intestini TaxID=1796634 RepID=A0A4R3JYQ8_9FIRM|nr:FAD-dependent oxidoreductase [Muricomes intestini]TCS72871.1 FAD dependent oxidoreductase [Muricomes intestini]
MNKKITMPAQECGVAADVDVLVVGGGAGGIGAAIGAALNGASTAIVDLYGSLGGLLTNGFITNCEAGVAVSGDNILVKGVFEKLVDRMVEKGGAIRGYELVKSNKYYPFDSSRCENDLQITPWDPEAFKLSADELMEEHGVKTFFYTMVTDILMEGNKVYGAVIENRSGRQVILAKRIIDCSGNLVMARAAGAECRGVGEKGSMTLMFRVGNVKNVTPSYKANVKDVPYGAVNFFPLPREGEFRVEMTRYIGSETSAEDYTNGTIECRKQCGQVLKFLKEKWTGFEDAYIIDSAPALGTICQPHLVGKKAMTKEIILNQEVMEDRIAITAYGIDLHSQEVGGQNLLYYLTPGDYYGVPYGVLVPKTEIENLLVAGKCVSSEEDATSGVLCSGICMALGEAAGTASAMSIQSDVSVRTIDVKLVQERLLQQGAIIDPVPIPEVNKYPVYESPLKKDPSLLKKFMN